MQKIFIYTGLISAALLTLTDVFSSYLGLKALIPDRSDSPLLYVVPLTVAVLAVSFNALSTHIFIECRDEDYTPISRMTIVGIWMACLGFDATSSFLGFLGALDNHVIRTASDLWQVLQHLDGAQIIFAFALGFLCTCGPLLATLFHSMLSKSPGSLLDGWF